MKAYLTWGILALVAAFVVACQGAAPASSPQLLPIETPSPALSRPKDFTIEVCYPPGSLVLYKDYGSLKEIAQESDLIIKGEVTNNIVSHDEYQGEFNQVFVNEIEVLEAFKGEPLGPEIAAGSAGTCIPRGTYYLFLKITQVGITSVYDDLPDKHGSPAQYVGLGLGRLRVRDGLIDFNRDFDSTNWGKPYYGMPESSFVAALRRAIQEP